VRFNEGIDLDTSQVEDIRDGGGGIGGRVALGGGGLGVIGIVLYLVMQFVGGGGGTGFNLPAGGLPARGSNSTVDNGKLAENCRTSDAANRDEECALVAVINSLQGYWTDQFARSGRTYQPAKTVFFNGAVNTGCGNASADVGPFYCPADGQVYIDLSFFRDLRQRFGAAGGTFVEAYVLAHEYGHHVQKLQGFSDRVGRETGPRSGTVRLELQADCFAGVWANHASTTPTRSGKPLIAEITRDDVNRALDAAGRIGDDFIQKNLGRGRVDPSSFTHGTSRQRQKWFTTGIDTGDPARCDTFTAQDLG
jgi:predicted metalloprotease